MQQDLVDLEILIAEKAKKVKQNLLDAYFEEKDQEYYNLFIDTPSTDYDTLTDLKMKVDALHELQEDINSMIEGGKVAQLTTGE